MPDNEPIEAAPVDVTPVDDPRTHSVSPYVLEVLASLDARITALEPKKVPVDDVEHPSFEPEHQNDGA